MDYQKVIVRNVEGLPLVRYAVSFSLHVVYLTDIQGVTEIHNTGETMRQIGFPREDVYYYDEALGIKENRKVNWKCLKIWSD